LRSIKLNDAQMRHVFFYELSMAQEGMIHTEDESDPHTQESQDKIQSFLQGHKGLWIIACAGDQVIGEVDITIESFKRLRHRGSLTIGVHPRWQGLGLGKILLEEAISWAKHAHLIRLDLSVFAHNLRARSLYQSFGFQEEGIRRKYLREQDGSFHDDILMALFI
jgi:RimJ/RimL family protein N-acetyltransferase